MNKDFVINKGTVFFIRKIWPSAYHDKGFFVANVDFSIKDISDKLYGSTDINKFIKESDLFSKASSRTISQYEDVLYFKINVPSVSCDYVRMCDMRD